MMPTVTKSLMGATLMVSLLADPARAAPLWQTTYDCPESSQTQWFSSTPLSCDGLGRAGGWYPNSDTAHGEQITSAANHPGGGGGRGQRHWIGDGTNVGSGGTNINFVRTPELWLRAYVRYQPGFQWNTITDSINHKMFYPEIVNVPGRGNLWFAFGMVDGHFGMQSYAPNPQSTLRWESIFAAGGSQSDGSWHCLEWHMKMDTNGSDGIAEGWVDGVLQFRRTNIDYGTHAGWASVHLAENHRTPANGALMWFDLDDVAISATGYLGPLGASAGGLAPAPPANLRVR